MAATLIKLLSLLAIVSGCSTSQSLWTLDSIAAGDSSRLRYRSLQAHPSLSFEMVRVGDQIEAFLSLTRFRFRSAESTTIFFTLADQSFEDRVPIHEGGMRVRLSPETTQWLIQALQDGHQIGILLEDFEETLDPSQFSRSFSQFLTKGRFFQNLFKGPVQ